MPQDFYKANLQGKSFKGQDLSGANFSYANIQGADFSHAILAGANFNYAQAGLQTSWRLTLVAFSLLLAFVAGLDSAYGGASVGVLLVYEGTYGLDFLFSILALLVLVAFGLVVTRRGWGTEAGILSVIIASIIAFVAAVGTSNAIAGAVVQAVAIAGAVTGIMTGALATTTTQILTSRNVSKLVIALALLGALTGTGLGISQDNSAELVPGLVGATGTTVALVWLSIYTAKQTLSGDSKYALIRLLSVVICTTKGTSFQHSDLTGSNFACAQLNHSDFRNTNLAGINWYQAKSLECARTGQTYLSNLEIRELLVTKDGSNKNFNRCDLRSLNLQNANLVNASLIGVDLSESDLENADLSGAKLVQAQLYRTNLMHAKLTGAYIQDWAISTDTCLDAIQCDFIFMRLPTANNPDPWRKPDNWQSNFEAEEFSNFISPIIKTLDLYKSRSIDVQQRVAQLKTLDFFHSDGLDPSAAAIALKQVAVNNPEAKLEILALEGRGKNKIRLQTKVARGVDQSRLHAEYFSIYSHIKSLPYSDIQSLLVGIEEKDERIRSLEKLLENALQQPRFYVETYSEGDYVMSQSKGNVNISGVQGNISGVAAAGENQTMTGVALGAISGNVTNTINRIPESSDPDKPSLKQLLIQLQSAIETEPELADDDKAEALEQVKTLAEAGQNPEDGALKKAAKTAMKLLKGTTAGLSETTKLVQEGIKLLPAIATLLALV